jgi:hypothetical protein
MAFSFASFGKKAPQVSHRASRFAGCAVEAAKVRHCQKSTNDVPEQLALGTA